MVLGQGDVGQLGLGEDVMERKKPFPVGGALASKNVVQVTCGGMHTVALTDEGEVRLLYHNAARPSHHLRLLVQGKDRLSCDRSLSSFLQPSPPLPPLSLFLLSLLSLSLSSQVFTWGCNDEGALGRKIEGEGGEYTPGTVEKMGHVKIVQVSAGDSHTAALANNGNVYCWGVFRVSM